ncbi:MAG: hypothetical protein KME16_04745 [Scytolyngbya sp. HA4215-MV1]|nr:hypothetical protein [Scytolyngbya sp. HA4215-MV1]
MLTGREKPVEVSIREGDTLPVRSPQLTGLSLSEGRKIRHEKGLVESDADCQKLSDTLAQSNCGIWIQANVSKPLRDKQRRLFRLPLAPMSQQ